jgi:hypothetical protein
MCALQSGWTSAPMYPHRVKTMRLPSGRIGVSSGQRSALTVAPWLQSIAAQLLHQQVTAAMAADVPQGHGRERR